MYRSVTFAEMSANSTLQLGIFVAELHRFVQSIEAVIQFEEERSRVFNVSSATYSVQARQLRNRRDNLIATTWLHVGLGPNNRSRIKNPPTQPVNLRVCEPQPAKRSS
jgi:hypothetical protein